MHGASALAALFEQLGQCGLDRIVILAADVAHQDATFLTDNPEYRMRIEGHTDSIGSEAYNLSLSKLRAEAAMGYLVNKGIDPLRIDTVGMGEGQPVASNDTDEGRQQNRRVELVVW